MISSTDIGGWGLVGIMVATAVVGTVSLAKREAARADRTGLYTRTVDTLATAVTPTARWHGVGLTWSALVRLRSRMLFLSPRLAN